MENLSLHIEYLLLHHDCVILPGVGAFLNIYEAPVFDFEAGVITPPKREIRFNPSLRSDDGLLANSYSRKYGMTHREGVGMIAREVDILQEALRRDGEVTVGRIGILALKEEATLVFSPFMTAIRYAEEIGRCPIQIKGKQQESTASTTLISNQDTPTPSSPGRSLDFDKNYYIPLNKTATKICASFLIVLIAVLSFMIPTEERNEKEERASVLPLERMIDTGVNKNDTVTVMDNEEKQPATEEKESKRYHLIVATCTTNAEATRYAEAFSSTGYDIRVMEGEKYSRVSAKSSDNRNELVEEMQSPDFKNHFSSSWIWDSQK